MSVTLDIGSKIRLAPKKPLGKPSMLPVRYRDHHLPMRDLVGAIGQVTHYLKHLNRW
jgi:hypothetical protein